MSDDAEGMASQAGVSQIVDLIQYQHQYVAYHPQYEQALQQEGEAQEEQVGPQVFPGGLTELSLLPNFDRHVACRLCEDVEVSIIV